MKRFKNILLVFDPEVDDNAAVSRAVSLAGRNHAELTLFSVVEELPPEIRTWTAGQASEGLFERVIEDRREQLRLLIKCIGDARIETKMQVVSGTPFLEIIRQVLRDRHDLVMVTAEGMAGMAGMEGFRARLFGNTTMHLMRKCPCPVWAIKPTAHQGYTRILAAVDPGSADAAHTSLDRLVMDLATSLARPHGSELHVIHAWDLPGANVITDRGVITQRELDMWSQGVRSRRETQLDDLLAHYSALETEPQVHLIKGRGGKEILELVRQKGIDLLVMGTVCRTGVAGFFIGNTAETVLAQVDCSVLSVKPERFVTPVTLENR